MKAAYAAACRAAAAGGAASTTNLARVGEAPAPRRRRLLSAVERAALAAPLEPAPVFFTMERPSIMLMFNLLLRAAGSSSALLLLDSEEMEIFTQVEI